MPPTFNSSFPAVESLSSPLVYLSAKLAFQISVATYVHIGATSVLIWDWLDNLRNDYKLLFKLKFGIPSSIYFATRISLLVFALGRAVLLTSPLGRCKILASIINAFPMVFVILTTLLFYIRVVAVYNRDRFVIAFFGLLWLASVGVSSIYYISVSAENLGPTDYCMETIRDPHHHLAASAIVFLVNDVLLYFAVVWRIYRMFLDRTKHSLSQKFKTLVFGASLPILSRIILLDSMIYFLSIVAVKAFLVFAIIYLEPPFDTMFVICHLVLVNILAGRIYRSLKMGFSDEREIESIAIRFGNPTEAKPAGKPSNFAFIGVNRASNLLSLTDSKISGPSTQDSGDSYVYLEGVTVVARDQGHNDPLTAIPQLPKASKQFEGPVTVSSIM